ncbi:MAG: 16S rRNA (uracil(1498)-N(3))-methyltransferase [Syntrophobacteraceae bacterium]|nr:16S rRNA (uracil(1498)-N(3))-methyltransferase [Syntrophobacteraceae bacterium]
MTRKCFFVDEVDLDRGQVTFTGPTAHHMGRVLRLSIGDVVELRDGRGGAWQGSIEAFEQGRVSVRLMGSGEVRTESPLDLTLVLAFSRSDRMEWCLRQATEIGVRHFVAFRSERSQYGLVGKEAATRQKRWWKIAREAMCQCGRLRAPEVHIYQDVDSFLSHAAGWSHGSREVLKLVACEEGNRYSLLDLWSGTPTCGGLHAVVGPEGGWASKDLDRFSLAGYQPVYLGPRVLRMETAATALLGAVQLLWGDFHIAREGMKT